MFQKLLELAFMKKGPGAHPLLSTFKKVFRKEHQETDLQLQRQSQESCACSEKEHSSCSARWEEPVQAGALAFSETPVGVRFAVQQLTGK